MNLNKATFLPKEILKKLLKKKAIENTLSGTNKKILSDESDENIKNQDNQVKSLIEKGSIVTIDS